MGSASSSSASHRRLSVATPPTLTNSKFVAKPMLILPIKGLFLLQSGTLSRTTKLNPLAQIFFERVGAKYVIAFWSSSANADAQSEVQKVLAACKVVPPFAFSWARDKCYSPPGSRSTESPSEKALLKCLQSVWEAFPMYSTTNTLLIDTSAERMQRNDPLNCILLDEWSPSLDDPNPLESTSFVSLLESAANAKDVRDVVMTSIFPAMIRWLPPVKAPSTNAQLRRFNGRVDRIRAIRSPTDEVLPLLLAQQRRHAAFSRIPISVLQRVYHFLTLNVGKCWVCAKLTHRYRKNDSMCEPYCGCRKAKCFLCHVYTASMVTNQPRTIWLWFCAYVLSFTGGCYCPDCNTIPVVSYDTATMCRCEKMCRGCRNTTNRQVRYAGMLTPYCGGCMCPSCKVAKPCPCSKSALVTERQQYFHNRKK